MSGNLPMTEEDDLSWRTLEFRQRVILKIYEAIHKSGVSTSRSSREMERNLFQKATNREQYLTFVARLLLHVREMKEEREKNRILQVQEKVRTSNWFAYDTFEVLLDKYIDTLNTVQNKDNFHEEKGETEVTGNGTVEDSKQDIPTQDVGSQTRSAQGITLNPPKSRKRKLESQSDSTCMDQAFKLLERCVERDACGVYGEHIAMKLRTYSKRTQAMVQHHINDILFNADMGQYNVSENLGNPINIHSQCNAGSTSAAEVNCLH